MQVIFGASFKLSSEDVIRNEAELLKSGEIFFKGLRCSGVGDLVIFISTSIKLDACSITIYASFPLVSL